MQQKREYYYNIFPFLYLIKWPVSEKLCSPFYDKSLDYTHLLQPPPIISLFFHLMLTPLPTPSATAVYSAFMFPSSFLSVAQATGNSKQRRRCLLAALLHADQATRTCPSLSFAHLPSPLLSGSALKLTRRNPTQGRHFTANQQEKCSISCRPLQPAETEAE